MADDTTRGFTKKQLKKVFKNAGLEILFLKRAKYLSEFYDSGLRLLNKMLGKDFSTNRYLEKILVVTDSVLVKIPLINWFNWHWSVIACKPINKKINNKVF